ncbi:MAG: hypothetical protein JEZ04_08670 [Spirochaetales bacterium]|nr:hypothetical protein [Spirochaetales bacterium]
MKIKSTFFLVILILISSTVFGESFSQEGILVAPGSINANVGAGGALIGGFEYSILSVEIAELPFTIGAAARAGVGWSFNYPTVGAYATAHFALAALDLPEELEWIGNFDFYEGLGLNFTIGSASPFGFGWLSGVSYYFSENLAVFAEGCSSGSGAGILFKL